MKWQRSAWKLSALVFSGVAVLLLGWKASDKVLLPGARPTIDAANYPSLQAALDAVPAAGGLVILPPGEFEIQETLWLQTTDTTLQGSGAATHIINRNESGQPALMIGKKTHGDKKPPGSDHLWRIRIADLRITGNEKSGHGIAARYVEEIFIHGVSISHHGGNGIHLDQAYEDPRVSDCLITYNTGVGLYLYGCHDIIVSANQFEENQDAVHCIDGYNLCMTGNNLDDHLGHGVVVENTYGSVISGNMIEECAGAAVILDRDCYGDTVSANVIAHNGLGVDLRDAHGCAVSANTFTILKTNAVRVGPASGRITVSGNNFSNSYLGDGKLRRVGNDLAAAGMVVEGASDIAITGNVFASVRPQGLELKGECPRLLVSGNLFVDAENDAKELPDGSLSTGNLTSPGK
ncbi:right-handed parallel beta-helix repeat-containing protein [Lignipirellula cremea]|uniref:Pectate lyase superfamily protein n=1 Tax=Lignipirellula cremea TaxID=2528010 RepID=A0A518DS02_9BACT|nr:right-handed parallel beta-helix repeat-containing protein [Lignipirellula cremea]QDU94620.1 Pectate lyase superfamily protein [Lignipirellula cremea]